MTVEYCPTEDMIADFFTKPLQGTQFRKLRALIMNLTESAPVADTDANGSDPAAETQECVGSRGGDGQTKDRLQPQDQ